MSEDTKWTEDQLKSPHTQRHIRDISDKPSTVDTQALEAMARISRKYQDGRD